MKPCIVNTLSRTRVLEICVTVGCRECEKRQKQPWGREGTCCPQGWDKLLTALRGQTHHMSYAVPVARGLQAYSVRQDIPDPTFYLGVLTQPPPMCSSLLTYSAGARRHLASCSASPILH